MDAIEEVKSRLSIEDVISEYVQLKRAGRNFKGLSPFSAEKSPSFMVSPEKQIWHDFSSGKGGNVFSFVMEMEGLDFKGALEHLARKAGVDLTQYQSGRTAETGKLKERLYQANEIAARFYQVQFSKNQVALEYIFKKRQFTKDIALAFRIGYSPNTGHALSDFLKSKGFNEKEIQSAGLGARRYSGSDMFRGRIMIPLQDAQGRVIGFTARILEDDPNAPKYINTPQTLLYDKGRHVYGLHLAKDAIREKKWAVLVEGNLDVIASHQAGVKEVVATAGTALTEMHLKALSRFTNDLRLAFDQDRAGLAATERAIPIASKVGVTLSMITVPEGKDPDELVRKDPEAWVKVIEQNQYALDWLIDRHSSLLDLSSAPGKREFSDVMLAVIRRLEDHVEQDHYLSRIAKMLGVSVDAMRSKMTDAPLQRPVLKKNKAEPVKLDKNLVELNKLQDHLMALCVMRPSLRNHLQFLEPDMLENEQARELMQYLRDHPDFDGKLSIMAKDIAADTQGLHLDGLQGADEKRNESYTGYDERASEPATQRSTKNVGRGLASAQSEDNRVQALGDYVKIVGLQYETLYQDLEDVELQYEATRIQIRLIEMYVKRKKAELAAQMREADDATSSQLLAQANKYNELLQHTKEVMHGG